MKEGDDGGGEKKRERKRERERERVEWHIGEELVKRW
jgi:hypothetical protein